MKRFTKMMKKNSMMIITIGVYIITLMFVLMFFSKNIDNTLIIGGFSAVAGIFGAIIGFLKYQRNKVSKK